MCVGWHNFHQILRIVHEYLHRLKEGMNIWIYLFCGKPDVRDLKNNVFLFYGIRH